MRSTLTRFLGSGRALITGLIGFGLVLVVLRAVSHLYVDVLWFRTVGYSGVFWRRLLWEWGLRAAVVLAAAAIAYVNLRFVAGTLGAIRIRRRFANLEISEQLPRSYIRWTLLGCAALFGLWFGAAVPAGSGVELLTALNSGGWGVREPVFGLDAQFYVFVLPLLRRAVRLGLALCFLLFAVSLAGYSATGSVRLVRGRPEMGAVARKHLGMLVAVWLVLLAAAFGLARYGLLLDGSSDVAGVGIFGHTDAAARLPALQGMAGITLVAGMVFGWAAWERKLPAAIGSLGVVVVFWVFLTQLFPGFVQRFRVQPNELERESVHIERNLEYTRLGFGLTDLVRQPLGFDESQPIDWAEAEAQLSGVPVWGSSPLLTTFREVEAQRAYYEFQDVVIDRYPDEDGRPQLVALSVREVDQASIPEDNWQNRHLRELYLAGMGAVAVSATDRTATGRPRPLLTEIPPRLVDARVDALELRRPSVFFGVRRHDYAVVNAAPDAFLAPDGAVGVAGEDHPLGIVMSSPLRTLSLAWRFRDANLLFAAEISDSSRFVFRRRVRDRLAEIAPFLRFPVDPYPVVQAGRLIWVADGYTDTNAFPLSTRTLFEARRPVNYIRNSVKATVDAVTGDVRFYVADADDPILEAYGRAFPTLLAPLADMPADLRAHLRYPPELLELQSSVLLVYHQETAFAFHRQEDAWEVPEELGQENRAGATQAVVYRPAYAHFRLPGEPEPEFLLSTVFVPRARQNLKALLVARADPEHYGELLLYDVESEDLRGPRQVEALIEQDPIISQQFSLWRQSGSQVWLGHLYLIPIGDRLLYMEPIYLAAEADAIPDLQRFVVSDGRRVVMDTSIRGALTLLAGDTRDIPAQPGLAAGESESEALQILDEAEALLREGDFAGFGARLQELRRVLEGRRAGGA